MALTIPGLKDGRVVPMDHAMGWGNEPPLLRLRQAPRSCQRPRGGQVDVWDHERSEPVASFAWGADTVTAVRFNPADSELLASAASDRAVALYDLRNAAPVRKLVMQARRPRARKGYWRSWWLVAASRCVSFMLPLVVLRLPLRCCGKYFYVLQICAGHAKRLMCCRLQWSAAVGPRGSESSRVEGVQAAQPAGQSPVQHQEVPECGVARAADAEQRHCLEPDGAHEPDAGQRGLQPVHLRPAPAAGRALRAQGAAPLGLKLGRSDTVADSRLSEGTVGCMSCRYVLFANVDMHTRPVILGLYGANQYL
jgi:hypothetical protein